MILLKTGWGRIVIWFIQFVLSTLMSRKIIYVYIKTKYARQVLPRMDWNRKTQDK